MSWQPPHSWLFSWIDPLGDRLCRLGYFYPLNSYKFCKPNVSLKPFSHIDMQIWHFLNISFFFISEFKYSTLMPYLFSQILEKRGQVFKNRNKNKLLTDLEPQRIFPLESYEINGSHLLLSIKTILPELSLPAITFQFSNLYIFRSL